MKESYKNYIVAIVSSLIAFVLYVLTLAPSVFFTDSGELASAAITLGIAHPTGYPLFILLSHIWSLLPINNSPIFQQNVLSAVFIAISVGVLQCIVKKILDFTNLTIYLKFFISFFTALLFASALIIWQLSNSIEVYPLQVLIFSLIILYAIKSRFENKSYWYVVSLLIGLGFANHLSIIFIIPGIIYFFFIDLGKSFSINRIELKTFLLLFIPLIIGLSFYLYLPLRSASLPTVNWGWVHRGLNELLYHIQGKQYQIWMFSGENLDKNIINYFSNLPYQLGVFGIFTSLIGVYRLFKINKDVLSFLLISAVFNFFYAINYSIHDIDAYFALSILILIIFSGLGIVFLFEKVGKLILPIALLLPLINIIFNLDVSNQSNNYLVEDYTKAVCSTLDSNAIIITAQWDYFNSAMIYYQNVENYRKDITIVEKELMRRTWYPLQFERLYPALYNTSKREFQNYQLDLSKFESGSDPMSYPLIQNHYIEVFRSIIEKNIDTRPIYIGIDILETEPEIYKGYHITPKGLSFKLSKSIDSSVYNFNNKLLDRFIQSKNTLKMNYLDSGIVNICASNLLSAATYFNMQKDKISTLKALNLSYKINQDVRILNSINELKK
ncbi:MAG TPA: DUF2723 domain-containing protein [Candidatus Kapabacteria bacterium]|nr:DUF2723 domain-containing protein [Candidatus Kapabacteria bacterium]